MPQNRRDFIRNATLTSLGLGALPAFAEPAGPGAPVLKLVHFTDVHLRQPHDCPKRLRRALAAIRAEKPDILVNTGDTIDGPRCSISREVDHAWKWAEWKRLSAEGLPADVPHFRILGNHDAEGPVSVDDAVREMAMPAAWHAADHRGWRFIGLDSTRFAKHPAQWNWLETTLRETPATTPIVICTHHPICSPAATLFLPNDIMARARELAALFATYPNVKLALSGHTHIADQARARGIVYTNAGSLGGAWWETDPKRFPGSSYYGSLPGYNVIRLTRDAVVSVEFKTWA